MADHNCRITWMYNKCDRLSCVVEYDRSIQTDVNWKRICGGRNLPFHMTLTIACCEYEYNGLIRTKVNIQKQISEGTDKRTG